MTQGRKREEGRTKREEGRGIKRCMMYDGRLMKEEGKLGFLLV